MTDARPFGTLLRTAAAALIAAAAVASCTAGVTPDGDTDEPATVSPSDPADDDTAAAGAAPASETSASETAGDDMAEPAAVSAPATPGTPSTSAAAPTASAVDGEFEAESVQDTVFDGVEVVSTQAADPVTIRIPSIQVEAPIIGLGLRDDGSIEVPADPDETGWWRGGPEPGETGPAVILGHIDSLVGPAVFYRLRDLQAGDPVHIDREDGTTVTYLVESSARHDKDAFPTNAVYGPTEQPTLRLVTCGGVFDRTARSYEDNFIVFASLS